MSNNFFLKLIEAFIEAENDTKFFSFLILFLSAFIFSIKSKITNQKICPHCKKDKTYRTKQNFVELYLFRLENYKKYKCTGCARSFFIKNYQ